MSKTIMTKKEFANFNMEVGATNIVESILQAVIPSVLQDKLSAKDLVDILMGAYEDRAKSVNSKLSELNVDPEEGLNIDDVIIVSVKEDK